jgi:hypothetical protein
LAPGSKSVAARATGGITPPYDPRSSHHRFVYWSGVAFPANTSQRHLSIVIPNGRNATWSSARRSRSSVSPVAAGSASSRPISFR